MQMATLNPAFSQPLPVSIDQRQDGFNQTPWHHAGPFMWQPTFSAVTSFTDNIRASRFRRQSDTFLAMTPTLKFKTMRTDRGITGQMSVNLLQFKKYTAQNQLNSALRLASYYTLHDDWKLTGLATVRFDHELTSAESSQPLANEPTPFQQTLFSIHARHSPHRITTDIFAICDAMSFNNTRPVTGQRIINNDRNHTDLDAGIELGLQNTAHDTEIGWRSEILQQSFARNDFNSLTNNYNGFNRDNQGWRSQVTFRYEPASLLSFKTRAGFERKNFMSPWHDKTTPVGSIQGLYLVTPLTNLHFGFEQSIAMTAYDTAAAYTSQQTSIGLKHELTRNIVLNITGQHTNNNYWDNPRHDTVKEGVFTLSYRQNRAVTWQAGYHYQRRDSSVTLAEYFENRILLGTRVIF